MSAEAFVQALHHSQATGTTKVVMLAIANFASENGAWCAIATLAKIANVSDDNTRKAVRKLEELGEIETERNGGFQMNKPKHTRTNRYEITIQCPEWCDRSMNHRDTRTHNSGPPKSTDRRNRRTDESDAPGPPKSTDEPKDNQQPNQELNTLTDLNANDRVSEPDTSQDGYTDWTPGDQIAKARKRMTDARGRTTGSGTRYVTPPAPHVPRFDRSMQPPAPEDLSPADAALRLAAISLTCPANAGKPHMIPARATTCMKCGQDASTIAPEGLTA